MKPLRSIVRLVAKAVMTQYTSHAIQQHSMASHVESVSCRTYPRMLASKLFFAKSSMPNAIQGY